VSGQDRKFPPAPETNQIAGFREFRPLTSQEKNNDCIFIKILIACITNFIVSFKVAGIWFRFFTLASPEVLFFFSQNDYIF